MCLYSFALHCHANNFTHAHKLVLSAQFKRLARWWWWPSDSKISAPAKGLVAKAKLQDRQQNSSFFSPLFVGSTCVVVSSCWQANHCRHSSARPRKLRRSISRVSSQTSVYPRLAYRATRRLSRVILRIIQSRA